jgi:ElaB/YqjD/DUF883 family membrane-anchored ribosome-binding protein
MDMSRSILLPLSNVAKNLATIAKNAADTATDFDSASLRSDLSDTAQHLLDVASERAQEAREIAKPRIKQAIAATQERFYALRDLADEQAKLLAKSSTGKTVARHPIATAVAVAGAGYLLVYSWRRYRAAIVAKRAKQPSSRPRVARATNGSGKVRTTAARKPVHV